MQGARDLAQGGGEPLCRAVVPDEVGHVVEDDHPNPLFGDQVAGDLQGLERVLGRRQEHAAQVHAGAPGIVGVEGALQIDDGHHVAGGRRLGHRFQDDGGLARGVSADALRDPASRQPTDAQRPIQDREAGGDVGEVGFAGGRLPGSPQCTGTVSALERCRQRIQLAFLALLAHGMLDLVW